MNDEYPRPKYSWEYPDGQYPRIHDNVGVGRTLEKGDCVKLNLVDHSWSETSPHLIVRVYMGSGPCFVAIPASIVGKLAIWLRDRSRPPRHPWCVVEFWLHRTYDDEWVWFEDGSVESLSYLPGQQFKAEQIVSRIMNS